MIQVETKYWDADFTAVNFGSGPIQAVKLTLKSNPSSGLVIYELGNGINIATWPMTYARTHTVYSGVTTDLNRGFVEAHVNPMLFPQSITISRKQGTILARKGKLSDATMEFFNVYLPMIKGMLNSSKRSAKVERMKALIKDLGDLSEEEMLDLWREARAEEVMSS